MHRTRGLRGMRGGLAIVSTLLVASCSGSDDASSVGKISATLSHIAGEYLVFALRNGSQDSIRMKGWDNMGNEGGYSPADYTVTCYALQNSERTTAFPSAFHHPPIESVSISPGEEVTLKIKITGLQRSKDRLCNLELVLESGVRVNSGEFALP